LIIVKVSSKIELEQKTSFKKKKKRKKKEKYGQMNTF